MQKNASFFYKTWSIKLRIEHLLKGFENWVQRRVFVLKGK